jgi:hypothetical protein
MGKACAPPTYTKSSPRTRGPIRPVLGSGRWGRLPLLQQASVVMGPRVRGDDIVRALHCPHPPLSIAERYMNVPCRPRLTSTPEMQKNSEKATKVSTLA